MWCYWYRTADRARISVPIVTISTDAMRAHSTPDGPGRQPDQVGGLGSPTRVSHGAIDVQPAAAFVRVGDVVGGRTQERLHR